MATGIQFDEARPGTILLVEDSLDDAHLVKRAFARGGILNPIQVVGDGQAAIAYLIGQGSYSDRSVNPLPIFILLDLVLPNTSGFEVLNWMKSHPTIGSIPVIVLSGMTDLAQVNRVYQMGALTFMVKPLRTEELTIRFPRLKGFSFVTNPSGGRYIQVRG